MLKRWTIENFKSFRDKTEIKLAPITVFAGANSSGKSTIIQSILTIKQTLQYAPSARALALNGPLIKLGTFDDVRNVTGSSSSIGISWELQVDRGRRPYASIGSRTSEYIYSYYYGGSGRLASIVADLEFDFGGDDLSRRSGAREVHNELQQLNPLLLRSRIRASIADDSEEGKEGSSEHKSFVEVERITPETKDGDLGSFLKLYGVSSIDQEARAEFLDARPDAEIVGATIRHFFPAQILVRFDEAKDKARKISQLICGRSQLTSRAFREHQDSAIPIEVAKRVADVFEDMFPQLRQTQLFDTTPQQTRLEYLIEQIRRVRRVNVRSAEMDRQLNTRLTELQPQLESILANTFPSRLGSDFLNVDHISAAASYASDYFSNSVRYLGPLRDEPKPIYPLEALGNPTDVGYRGEHTAAVLDLHKDSQVSYLASSFAHNLNDLSRHHIKTTLHDAVVDWLSYVGVAEDVITGDQGKFGHRLQVQTSGLASAHDLTNVGVGVSQVLPIIVMALIAEPPALLIFEQPELHLHPKVQARLADFFFSLAIVGKQCLLETHSEYLIERFRRRIAEAEGDSLKQHLSIYFTERQHGHTTCRPVDVSKYGAIAEWPDDFFDQSQIETQKILEAGLTKKRSEKEKE